MIPTASAETRERSRREWATLLVLVAAGTYVWAGLCTFVLDVSTVHNESIPWWRAFGHPGESLVSSLVVWASIMLVFCLTNRLWLSCALALGASLVISLASVAKFRVREEPLYPSDLYFLWQPSFLFDMASPRSLMAAVLGVAVIVAVLVFAGRRLDRVVPRVRRATDPIAWSRIAGLRVVVALVSAALLFHAAHFNEPGNKVRATFEASGANLLPWRQANNYVENGFVAGFLYNTPTEAMKEPAGYGPAVMKRIAERYSIRADQLNAGRSPAALADVNVVLLLSESFSDPEHLNGVDLAEDPIPFVRETMADHPSGQVVSNGFGGGTANMEFEALTGMSQYLFTPQTSTPYQMLVPQFERFPSAARYFTDEGHQAVAVHPFIKSMFRRSEVYPRLGFEAFLDIKNLTGLATIGLSEFATDESTFAEVLRLLKGSEEPLFMNLVTMQNHFPFEGIYEDPIANTIDNVALGHYARGIAHSDDATEELLDELAKSREKTLVIFYGDHLPGIYGADVLDSNSPERLREAPFFLWSNYRKLPATRFAPTSPNYFMPLALEAAGARQPPYYALLLDLHAELPTLNAVDPIDPSALSSRARRLLRDFRLVQYDFSVGERHAVEEMFQSARTNSSSVVD